MFSNRESECLICEDLFLSEILRRKRLRYTVAGLINCLIWALQGCTARNIHGFTRDDVEKMAGIWEEAPSIYLQLDAKVQSAF